MPAVPAHVDERLELSGLIANDHDGDVPGADRRHVTGFGQLVDMAGELPPPAEHGLPLVSEDLPVHVPAR